MKNEYTEFQKTELKSVIQAALLHDIGKLFFRAGENENHIDAGLKAAYELWSSEEIPKIIRDGIEFHHKYKLEKVQNTVSPETWIIYEADNIAAGIDRRDETELAETAPHLHAYFEKPIPLKSVFDVLNSNTQKIEQPVKDDQDPESFFHHYPLRMLGYEDRDGNPVPLYPLERNSNFFKASSDLYQRIACKWHNEVKEHGDVLRQNSNALLLLMEATLSFVPSDTYNGRIPDISLYEHLRLTAAIASCMYCHAVESGENIRTYGDWKSSETHRKKEQFLLIGADISGIQKFIYNISSKGALKSLRARSFYLEILSEHIVDEILEFCGGFSRANLIFNGGGHFYLLLPNTSLVIQQLEKTRQRLNQWLWDEFKGGLSFVLEWESCTAEDLMNSKDPETKQRANPMKEKWEALSQKLSLKKARKFADLQSESFESLFNPGPTQGDSSECIITQLEHDLIPYLLDPSKPDEKSPCNRMAVALHRLGKDLPTTDYIWVKRHVSRQEFESAIDSLAENPDSKQVQILLPDLTASESGMYSVFIPKKANRQGDWHPLDEQKLLEFEDQYPDSSRLYSINRWVLSRLLYANLLVGNYYPNSQNNEMPDFKELAEQSTGAKKIAVLRADVDDLGILFKSKLSANVNTFGRVAMLSKHLSLFFKLYINQICNGKLYLKAEQSEKDRDEKRPETILQPFHLLPSKVDNEAKDRDVVIVYAGGDDLFIVGAWNEVLELSIDIHRCFETYTCGKLTLSAGVQMFDPHTPISLMASVVGDAEKKAKDYYRNPDKKEDFPNPDKNALCLFPNPAVLTGRYKRKESKDHGKHRDVYAWDDLKDLLFDWLIKILEQNFKLEEMIEESKKSRRLKLDDARNPWLTPTSAYQFYALADRWVKDGVVSLPQLAYTITRLEERLKGEEKGQALERFKDIKSFLYDAAWIDSDDKRCSIQDFKTLFTWISYLSREEK